MEAQWKDSKQGVPKEGESMMGWTTARPAGRCFQKAGDKLGNVNSAGVSMSQAKHQGSFSARSDVATFAVPCFALGLDARASSQLAV